MTTYSPTFFDSTDGIIEELVLTVIALKLLNSEYKVGTLNTDFVSNAVKYSISADTDGGGNFNANLNIELIFLTMPIDRQILIDQPTFSERIASINTAHLSNAYLPRKPLFPQKSPSPSLPPYLMVESSRNTLERRLFALCSDLRAKLNWIDRWNNVAQAFLSTNPLQVDQRNSYFNLGTELLQELVTGITFKRIDVISQTPQPIIETTISGEASTFSELAAELGGRDPIGEGGNELESDRLFLLLTGLGGGGSPQPESPPSTPQEEPTLPDC